MTSFAFGQALTAVFWGRFADKRGRKPALLLGLIGTGISITIFGTSQSIYVAILGRLMCGMLNGNVGVMRSMVAELIGNRKEYQTRAFAILPIVNNVGTIVGPMIGGMLADPARAYPDLFGNSDFLKRYPFILPNLFPLPFIVFALVSGVLFIEETSESERALLPQGKDVGLKIGGKIKTWWNRRNRRDYLPINIDPDESFDSTELVDSPRSERRDSSEIFEEASSSSPPPDNDAAVDERDTDEEATGTKQTHVSLRDVLTPEVKVTLTAYALLTLHAPTFNQVFPVFLSTPRMDNTHDSPFIFNGGLGLPTPQIGLIMSILGGFAVFLNLFWYPGLANRLGNARLHKLAVCAFPIGYILTPYLSFVPATPGWLPVSMSTIIATALVISRTFALPPMTVLMTNCAPSRQVLGTVHGLTHSVTSLSRTLGPFTIGSLYSIGVRQGIIGLSWWISAAVVLVELYFAMQLREW
jgi:MFS family permease